MRRIAVIIALAGSFAASAVLAQSRWDTQVADQLNQAGSILRKKGFAKDQSVRTGSLREGEGSTITLTLQAGKTYALLGICDNDCADLDLHLYDTSDNEVSSDTQTHDAPLVRVTPRETGEYRLKVVMTACSTSPCYYGVGVYRR